MAKEDEKIQVKPSAAPTASAAAVTAMSADDKAIQDALSFKAAVESEAREEAEKIIAKAKAEAEEMLRRVRSSLKDEVSEEAKIVVQPAVGFVRVFPLKSEDGVTVGPYRLSFRAGTPTEVPAETIPHLERVGIVSKR